MLASLSVHPRGPHLYFISANTLSPTPGSLLVFLYRPMPASGMTACWKGRWEAVFQGDPLSGYNPWGFGRG